MTSTERMVGRLPVAEPAEVPQDLRDDARRGDPRDAGEGDGRDRAPPQDEGEDRAGKRVEQGIEDAGHAGTMQSVDQLCRGVLESEHDQQQDDPDLAADLEEVLAGRERDRAAVTERQSGDEIEGDRRDPDPGREPGEQAERQQERAHFEQQERRLVHGRGGCVDRGLSRSRG